MEELNMDGISDFSAMIQTIGINNPEILKGSPYTALLLKA